MFLFIASGALEFNAIANQREGKEHQHRQIHQQEQQIILPHLPLIAGKGRLKLLLLLTARLEELAANTNVVVSLEGQINSKQDRGNRSVV
jgi:hypothetical protein